MAPVGMHIVGSQRWANNLYIIQPWMLTFTVILLLLG